jgi:hypothetical protein
MTPEQAIYQANRAKEVLDNEAYQLAFDQIKAEIDAQWKSSPARDVDGRERLWLMQSLLTKLQTTLQQTMDSGKLAAADLRHKQTLRERASDLLR